MELFGVQVGAAAKSAKPRFCTWRAASRLATIVLGAGLAACATRALGPRAAANGELRAVWVEMVPQPQARAIVAAGASCPTLVADGKLLPMALRVGAGEPPMRPLARPSDPAKPALFPVEVCAADLPEGTRSARVGDRNLPVRKLLPQRIVVIGDSGCRIKGDELQDCNDSNAWPFVRVAAAAAALKPDLVIHVGDYHYRETPCPASRDCRGPWGYGWDAWEADFFVPASPLLAAAPWVLVRGNHEECNRAGQGWSRMLAPEAYRAERSCDDPAHDDVADFSEPYAVPLGGGTQIVVFDSAHAGNTPLKLDRQKDALIYARYVAEMKQVAALTAGDGMRSWFVSHHPVLAFAPREGKPEKPYPGNAPLQSAMRSVVGDVYFPAGVQAALHGHVHNFQAIDFSSSHPATLVAGNGGDNLDDSLPHPFPKDWPPAPGAVIDQITTANSFGFLLLERGALDSGEWAVHAYRVDGSLLARCSLKGDRSLRCDSGRG